MAPVEVVVPDIGDFSDVPVIEVLVAVGDTVGEEDPLVTLESDKATMDVPSPFAGKVTELKVNVGDKVSEGDVLALVEAGDAGAAEATPQAEPPASEAGAESSVESAVAAEAQAAGPEDAEAPPPEPEVHQVPPPDHAGESLHASPAVRRLARELEVDLSTVRGTGRKGRITKDDLRRAIAGTGPAGTGAGATDLGLAPWPVVEHERYGPVERVPLSRIKRISGPNLARNWVRIPHVTQHDEADVTELEAFRKRTNAEQSEAKVTMVALLLKACVASLKAYPEVNSSLDGEELVLKRHYHLGFAADTPGGLVVPVIRDVDQKGLLDLAKELTTLSKKARDGKLTPGEMSGGTFTISSLGGIGGTAFTPIVNAPQVAILGVSRSAMKPVWDGTQFVPRLMLPLSLSYDHRVIDGALAARFCVHLADVLSDMRRVLL
ncbi:dihydrolipoyllysine-residue acetyltransferase [Conexibacter sp. SYSU D00693]|uniref:dihydrolipoyllysine-residue acetyltransferase n=1 Tax=Conexibacter sp. SYSU D00693 TaxID=2812560 RepID=UPI001F122514|nr:dihydrolipoyllysine-residue acetyltransferase [Conexibacter sp. SYSU D00693]